jgi:Arc/MetJ-type ribon-helix-helix transcriptional regulator
MKKERKIVNWCIPVPVEFDNSVEEALKTDLHATKSELVRDAVRRLLEKEYPKNPKSKRRTRA